ncbi:PhoPQ-activated pathogenicity-related family protein [soil metagenome]
MHRDCLRFGNTQPPRHHARSLGWILGLAIAGLIALAAPVQAELFEYVLQDDPSFSWKVEKNDTTPLGTVYHIDLTSQTWRDILWTHKLRIYEPKDVPTKDVMLLYITGGSTTRQHNPAEDPMYFGLANFCGARIALLPQVPNQPLMGDRYEDDLIAETFLNYLKDGDEDWPLLQPMVKSAVKAMDAAQEWAKEKGEPVERFVVTGASKRGWTTWLSGAVDDRVAGIAPMVIPTLNMKAQSDHQLDVWGFHSEQIADYTRRGLTESFDTPEGAKLWRIVDPYFYLDKITVPKLQINGTNDRYWTLDSVNVFWDDIQGPSHVVYLPNAGHGLDQNREYATHGIAALFRHVVQGKKLPDFSWEFPEAEDGSAKLVITFGEVKPRSIQVWGTAADTRDYRESNWMVVYKEDIPEDADQFRFEQTHPGTPHAAFLGDLTFEIDGLEYHLSTTIRELPAPAAEQ